MGDFDNPWVTAPIPPLPELQQGERLYALVDAAQTPGVVRGIASLPGVVARQPVLGEPLALERQDATPHLLQLRSASALPVFLTQLSRITASHGALSLLVARHEMAGLARALKVRQDVVLPDGLACVNRYFDGRVAPHLVECLSDGQRASFGAFASQWSVLGHDGQWLALECRQTEHDPFEPPLRLDERQQALMVDACYPYALIEHFERSDAELLARVHPKRRYALFRDVLRSAANYGIEGGANAMLFCTLALTRGAAFHESPAWQAGLARVQRGDNSLQDLMKTIND